MAGDASTGLQIDQVVLFREGNVVERLETEGARRPPGFDDLVVGVEFPDGSVGVCHVRNVREGRVQRRFDPFEFFLKPGDQRLEFLAASDERLLGAGIFLLGDARGDFVLFAARRFDPPEQVQSPVPRGEQPVEVDRHAAIGAVGPDGVEIVATKCKSSMAEIGGRKEKVPGERRGCLLRWNSPQRTRSFAEKRGVNDIDSVWLRNHSPRNHPGGESVNSHQKT